MLLRVLSLCLFLFKVNFCWSFGPCCVSQLATQNNFTAQNPVLSRIQPFVYPAVTALGYGAAKNGFTGGPLWGLGAASTASVSQYFLPQNISSNMIPIAQIGGQVYFDYMNNKIDFASLSYKIPLMQKIPLQTNIISTSLTLFDQYVVSLPKKLIPTLTFAASLGLSCYYKDPLWNSRLINLGLNAVLTPILDYFEFNVRWKFLIPAAAILIAPGSFGLTALPIAGVFGALTFLDWYSSTPPQPTIYSFDDYF